MIYRELKRVKSASYDAQLAQDNATEHKSFKGRRPKHTPELIQDIQTKLELTWSHEQIVGRCYQNRLSFKTIYNWIYQGIINALKSGDTVCFSRFLMNHPNSLLNKPKSIYSLWSMNRVHSIDVTYT